MLCWVKQNKATMVPSGRGGRIRIPQLQAKDVNTNVLTEATGRAIFASMNPKSSWLQIRVTPEEKERLRAQASAAKMDLSTFMLWRAKGPDDTEFNSLIAWMLRTPDSHVPYAEFVDYLQTLPASRGAELAAMPDRFGELTPLHQNQVCGWIEHRAALWGVNPPRWVFSVPSLETPHYAGGLISLRPYLLVVTPVVYRRRNIFTERGLGWRLAPITPPATPDEAEELERAFAASAPKPAGGRVAENSPSYGKQSPLTRAQIDHLLHELDGELARAGIKADLLMVGGAVMTIVFKAREQTKDVDAIFEPEAPVRVAIAQIAKRENLSEDWLNDAAKGFLSAAGQFDPYLDGEALRVYVARADYLLAMKILAMRPEGEAPDFDDIRFLCRYLDVRSADQALDIVERYYPVTRLQPRHKFVLEEMLGTDSQGTDDG